MTYRWTCGLLRGECATADDLMQRVAELSPHARFVAQDETGAQVVCIDLKPRSSARHVEVPIVRDGVHYGKNGGIVAVEVSMVDEWRLP